MEAQGTMGSLIRRRVKASTTSITFYPPQAMTSEPMSGGGGGDDGEPAARFAVHLRCHVTMSISACPGRPKVEREYRGADAGASCHAVPGDEDGVRDALRGMLRSIRPLQDLGLTDGEWESIVPEDVVPLLVDPQARSGRYGAAELDLWVVRHVRYDAARVLMTGFKCKEIDDNDDGAVTSNGE